MQAFGPINRTFVRCISAGDHPGTADEAPRDFTRSAGMPQDLVTRLLAEMSRVPAPAAARSQAATTGVEATVSTPREFAEFVQAKHAKWGRVVRATGATVN